MAIFIMIGLWFFALIVIVAYPSTTNQRTDTEVKFVSYAEAEEMLKSGEWELCNRYEDNNFLLGHVYLQRKDK